MNSVLGRVSQVRGGLGGPRLHRCPTDLPTLEGVFIAPVCHELEVRGSVRDRSLAQPDSDILYEKRHGHPSFFLPKVLCTVLQS